MDQKKRSIISPLFRENFDVAVKSIKNNRLRSILTMSIIAIGITSLVGILTAIDALKFSINESFGKMGATSFYISRNYSQTTSSTRSRVKNKRSISYAQARMFKSKYDVPSLISISADIGSTEIVKYASVKTEPNVQLMAVDENYLSFNLFEIEHGRGLTENDMENASFNCVIGGSLAKTLFAKDDPVGKVINVRGVRYKVVGSVLSVGQSFGGSMDETIIIPLTNARALFINDESDFQVGIKASSEVDMQFAVDEAERIFRAVRRLAPIDETDFRIRRNDSMLSQMKSTMQTVTIASFVIGLITLLGAAVGLMNIMLVSVKERTREIGTRKALGATARLIRQQFFMEAIVIGQIGGLAGMILGALAGNITAVLMKVSFIVPWPWMLIAAFVCLLVSVMSGYIPAKRAAALDPIEALRYE